MKQGRNTELQNLNISQTGIINALENIPTSRLEKFLLFWVISKFRLFVLFFMIGFLCAPAILELAL